MRHSVDTVRFHRDGYLHLKGIFTPEEMTSFNRAADAFQAARRDDERGFARESLSASGHA